MSSDLAISVSGISKVYHIYEKPMDRLKQILWRGRKKVHDEFWALRDINFEVRKGETVGIVGRNGSGKSTLLQIICGTLKPSEGNVERHGRLSALLELGSGFNMDFTGRENVYLNASILGMTRSEVDERFDLIAGFADIGQFIDSPVKHYSSGMFARLAFSVAIHVDPEILIVDEILAVGDAAFQRRCVSKFYDIREQGCTVLFVSHDQYQVKSICQRALYLESGRQKIFGPAGWVIDAYMVDMEAAEAKCTDGSVATNALTFIDTAAPESAGPALAEMEVEAPWVPLSPHNENVLFPFLIESVRLTSTDGREVEEISTGEGLLLTMCYRAMTLAPPGRISFVFNLYRHDGFYICGTTTLMDGLPPYTGTRGGEMTVYFPSLPLLSGRYKWRVAINDHGGFSVLAEAKDVCTFSVSDNFDAVGLVNLKHEWQINIS